MNDYIIIIIFSLIFLTSILASLFYKERKAKILLQERFKNIVSVDDEELRIRKEIQNAETKRDALLKDINLYGKIFEADQEVKKLKDASASEEQKIEDLHKDYAEKRKTYSLLLKEISIFDEKLSFAEMGIYEPHFDFTDSEQYKNAVNDVRQEQKNLVSKDRAVICNTEWTVSGSASKGRTMTNRNIRLTLRAFNNECEAAIANTRWNNVNAMEKRIIRAQEQIDKLNASNTTYITKEYLNLKMKELYLTHEYREKIKEEREQKAESARLAREEQRLLRDQEEAERDEAHYKKLLDRAKEDAAKAIGPKLELYEQQIAILEKDLAEAHAKVERAQAMAERTKSGYVYIISNIGSFGESVVKIGLTRRLDPTDRIRELGDASVPFIFDTHAIIYSDDAPSLERALHIEFDERRINTQNYRKEFFKVSLDEVEDAVNRLAPDASFFKDIEAQEYFETLAKREKSLMRTDLLKLTDFPDTL